MEQLENIEVGGPAVEGLEVEEEESILPSPTPLLTQWDWRQVTVHPDQTAHLTQEYWFGLQSSSTDTGKLSRSLKILNIKGSVSVILCDPLCRDGNAHFTTVLLKSD